MQYAGKMNKKISAIIISIILVAAAVFGGTAYYLNKPYMVVARAFTAKSGSAVNGEVGFKLDFDTTKMMSLPEFQNNPFAALEVAAVKSAIESANIQLNFNGTTDGNEKLLLDGNVTLPEILGNTQDFNLYVDKSDVWSKSGDAAWVKAQNSGTSSNDLKVNTKDLLDFIKKCPAVVNGNTITMTLSPTVDDMKKIIPAETINEINKNSKDGLTFEQIMNALKITINITVNKNSKFFIPMPNVSKADITITGDMSKLVSSSSGIPDDQKAVLGGLSFTAKGSANIQSKAGLTVEKPSDIK